jgi:alpha-tubulin suppressor-like RCC1 family protein
LLPSERFNRTQEIIVKKSSILSTFILAFVVVSTRSVLASPQAKTLAATSVGIDNATFNASVNPNGAATRFFFKYGLTSSYGSVTTSKAIASGSSLVNVSNTASGLQPVTQYHFCAVAYNSTGTNIGADLSFTTINVPTVTTLAATSAGTNSATLNASVNPNGAQTTIYFQYGLTTNYGSVTISNTISAGTTTVNFSNKVSGLLMATQYHFCAVASSSAGINTGADVVFTTMDLPSDVPAVTNVSAGLFHSLFLRSDGSLWGMGDNFYGQLGDGTHWNSKNRPELLGSNSVVATAGGFYHSLLLEADGSLWGMGYNYYGQLGLGYGYSEMHSPTKITNNVTAIAAGAFHSLFVKSDGSLWAMGYNFYGQLGNGFTNSVNQPVKIVPSGVVAVAAQEHSSLFLTSDGSLWSMGKNAYGQLGDGTLNNAKIPEQIVVGNVAAIAAGGSHNLFLKTDGSLWGMGGNATGQLGDGTFDNVRTPEQIVASNVVAIAAGAAHTLFLKSDGSLWGMGGNLNGELGDGTTNTINQPEQIASNGIVAFACSEHSLFVMTNGSLWAAGYNNSGQLGDGFTNNILSLPEQIYPTPKIILASKIFNRTSLQFNTTCPFGGTFYLLESTNLNQPWNQWVPVQTNYVNCRTNNNYTATITNALNSSVIRQFYILESP